MLRVAIFLSLLATTIANDIQLGFASAQSRRIYSEIKEADPALWTRTDDIVVQAPDNELISAVYVTDLRDDKDGLAYVKSGGVGLKSVTIGIKSPSVLRGYKFHIEVYGNNPTLSGNNNARYYSKGGYPYSDDSQYSRKF